MLEQGYANRVFEMTNEHHDPHTIQLSKPPVVVQILAILGFTGFAIPVSIIAMDQFGLLGIALAAFLAWQWTRVAGIGGDARLEAAVDILKPNVATKSAPSGNSSFDAYRNELLNRLEKEQSSFEGFLSRLRDAKDKSEFDTFMVEREKVARARNSSLPA